MYLDNNKFLRFIMVGVKIYCFGIDNNNLDVVYFKYYKQFTGGFMDRVAEFGDMKSQGPNKIEQRLSVAFKDNERKVGRVKDALGDMLQALGLKVKTGDEVSGVFDTEGDESLEVTASTLVKKEIAVLHTVGNDGTPVDFTICKDWQDGSVRVGIAGEVPSELRKRYAELYTTTP